MKFLLVVKSKAIECLGPMYISAVAKRAGHECHIVDLPSAYDFALKWRPNLVGYSVLTGDQAKFKDLNARIREQIPIASLFGGSHATFFPDDFPEDAVALGESEQDIADLLKSSERYSDLDSLPWPDRSDFPNMSIRDFIASRGCASSCSYCFNATWNRMFPDIAKVRTRSAKDVVAEVESVKPQFAYFQDSCFGTNMKWMREFSDLYAKQVNAPYHCHLRPSQVNEERVLLLRDSNCVSVKCALETGSDRLRKLINRGHTNNEDAITASMWLRKWDIKLILQNILGLPSATIEDDLCTLEVNIRCRPAYAWCSIFQPYPSTPLADYCEKQGIYTGGYSEIGDNFFDKSVLNISDEHKEQIAVLQRIFAFAVEMQVMPKIKDLTWEAMPKFIHNVMRKVGDKRMFPGGIL